MLLSPPRASITPKLLSARSSMSVQSLGDPVLPPITGNKIITQKLPYEESELKKFGTVAYTADIGLMMQIKQEMTKLFGLSTKLINDNEATPDIQQHLSPVIEELTKNFEVFYRAGMHYFTQYYKIQQSAKANQVISSASCRIPIQTFNISWEDTKKIIEIYTESHPPPHAQEIRSKFNGIRNSFAFIQKSNGQRKNPSASLDNCINSLMILLDNLSNHVETLFTQQAFPHFETDLLSSYANDVQSFKKILLTAFSNEFIHAGIPTIQLTRLKNMITSNCSSIIDSLKMAFIFPDQMQTINSSKEILQKLLDSAIEKLSVPFAVIKPLDSGSISSRAPAPSLSVITAMENANAERKKHMSMDLMTKSIHNFIKTVEPFVGDIDETDNLWQVLDSLQIPVIDAFNQIKEQQEKIQELKSQMKEDVVLYTQKKTFLEQRVNFLQQSIEEKQKMLLDSQKKSKEQDISNSKLNSDICNLQGKINVLTNPGDPMELRNSIRESLYSLLSILSPGESLTIEESDNSIREVMNKAINDTRLIFNEKSRLQIISKSHVEFVKEISGLFGINTNKTSEIINTIKKIIEEKDEKIKSLEDEIKRLNGEINHFSEVNEIKPTKEDEKILDLGTQKIKDLTEKLSQSIKSHDDFTAIVDKNLRAISGILSSTLKDNTTARIESINGQAEQNVVDLFQLLHEQSNSLQPLIDALIASSEERQNVTEIYKSKYKNLSDRIVEELKIEDPPEHLDELGNAVIDAIKRIEDPYKITIQNLDSKIGDYLVQVRIIYARLCAITHKEVKDGDIAKLLNEITDLLSIVQDNSKFDDSLTSVKKSDLSLLRQTLEMIHVTLRKEAIKIDPEIDQEKEISKLSAIELTGRINNYVDIVTSPSYTIEYVSSKDIKKILAPVIETFDGKENPPLNILATTQTEFMKMYNTLNSLNDFYSKVAIAKKFVDDNAENFEVQFPTMMADISSSLENAAKNISHPPLLNSLIRLTQIVQFFVSHMV